MEKIARLTLKYRFARCYVMRAFKNFYRPYLVRGKENIPADSPVIFTANHLNALMDALALLSITPKSRSITFLARADIFKQKTIARFLTFAKIMPAYRMRDGLTNLAGNNESFGHAEAILQEGNYIGIMPEGAQGEERNMRPLVKGVFRIALSAQEPFGNQPKVKIIPVGIEMGDLIKFGQPLILNIGKPIEVSQYMESARNNAAHAMNQMRDELALRLHEQTVDIASQTYYEQMETIVYALDIPQCLVDGKQPNEINRFDARRKLAKRLCRLEQEQPEKMKTIAQQADVFKQKLTKMKLRPWLFAVKPYSLGQAIAALLGLLISLPAFLIGFVTNILPFMTPVWIRQAMKVKYSGFHSSIDYGISLITFPLFYLINTLLLCCLFTWQPLFIILVLVAQPLFGKLAFEWYRIMRKTLGMIRYTNKLRKKDATMKEAQEAYSYLSKTLLYK